MFIIILGALGYAVLAGVVVALVTFDTSRMFALMRRSPGVLAQYRCHLPNVLAALSEAGLPAWPTKPTGISAYRFKRGWRRSVADPHTRDLIESHLALWLHVEDRRALLELGLSMSIMRLARRICERGGDVERERYGNMLLVAQKEKRRLHDELQRQFGPGCLMYAEKVLADMVRLQIVFEEHGYQLHKRFAP